MESLFPFAPRRLLGFVAELTARDVAKVIGRRIAELRRARGWTQQQVADQAEMDLDFYKRIERGRVIKLKTLATVLQALGVTEREFLPLREPGHRPTRGRPPKKRRA